jgi:hypothetical protein
MREQAKKMNVTSLRAEDDGQRQEFKIAKVRHKRKYTVKLFHTEF